MSWWESNGMSDEWWTPAYVFDALGCWFDLDVASPPCETHVPCNGRITTGSLCAKWYGFVWMNPPFGGRNGIDQWMEKFFEHGNGIALSPDRTSAPWFQKAWARSDLVLFVSPKIAFEKPDGSRGKSPSTGTALWASGRCGVEALELAATRGLGVLARREMAA